MENQPLDESNPDAEESFLKPKVKAKRNITDEQRLVLAERMRAINDKRIADAMARKKELPVAKIEEIPRAKPLEKKVKEPKPARKVIKVVEVSEEEEESESESEDEVQYIIVPKKKVAEQAPVKKAPAKKAPAKKAAAKKPKPQQVYESESEEEAPKTILKPRKQKQTSQPQTPEPPKVLFRFL